MKTAIRLIIASLTAVFLSSVPILAYSEPPLLSAIEPNIAPVQVNTNGGDDDDLPITCPLYFIIGGIKTYKCVDPDDWNVIYGNTLGFISCTIPQ